MIFTNRDIIDIVYEWQTKIDEKRNERKKRVDIKKQKNRKDLNFEKCAIEMTDRERGKTDEKERGEREKLKYSDGSNRK